MSICLSASLTRAEESALDVNSKQHSTFMDGEDEIEDLSEDAILDEIDKDEDNAAI